MIWNVEVCANLGFTSLNLSLSLFYRYNNMTLPLPLSELVLGTYIDWSRGCCLVPFMESR